jgi:large subunit ribosomal protein L4
MPSLNVVDLNRRTVGTVEVPSDVFAVPVKGPVLHEVVMQQACVRQGNASTKTRGEVSGTGKKPYKQKHTGRARAGSSRSPLWRHGGTIFGPLPRDYSYTMPKKKVRGALRAALSVKVNEGGLLVLDELPSFDGKTKSLAKILATLGLKMKTLIVASGDDDKLRRAAANLNGVTVIDAQGLNVRDVLLHDTLLVARRDLSRMQELWA